MDLLQVLDQPASFPLDIGAFSSTFTSSCAPQIPLRKDERTLPSIHSLNLPGLSPSTPFSSSIHLLSPPIQPSLAPARQTRSPSSTLDGSSASNRKFSLTSTLQGLASRARGVGGKTERSSEVDDVLDGAEGAIGMRGAKDRDCACCPLPAKRRGPGGVRTLCSNCGLSFHRKIRRLEDMGATESQIVDAVRSFVSKRRVYMLAKSSGAEDEQDAAARSSDTSPALSIDMGEEYFSRSPSPLTPLPPRLRQVPAFRPIPFARHSSLPQNTAAYAPYPSPPTTYYPSPSSTNHPSPSTSSDRASHAEDASIRPDHSSPTFETSFTRHQHSSPPSEYPFPFHAFQGSSGFARGRRG